MEILEKVRELVKPQYDKLGCWIHSWMHIEDVVKFSRELAELEGIDPFPCIVAAYCHDLGRIEEELRELRGDLYLPHALLSIEPTIDVLKEVGIFGVNFAKIVEAVAVHSYRVYEGNNEVARILQDADKLVGLGPRGFLDLIKHFGKEDLIDPQEIIKHARDKEKLRGFDKIAMEKIKQGLLLENVIKGLNIKIEYANMFHADSAKQLGKEGVEYLKNIRDQLIFKFGV